MDKNTGYGLLSQFGLDLGDETDVRTAYRNQRIQRATQMNPASWGDPRGQAFGQFGAATADALAERFGRGPQLPVEIQSKLNTVSETKRLYGDWEKGNPEAKAADRAEKYQEFLAEAAFKNGLPDVGVMALRELQDRRLAAETKQAELEKLGLQNTYDKDTLKARTYKTLIDSSQAGLVEAYAVGSEDPNASVTGMFNPEDGSLTIPGPDGKPQVLPMGTWKTTRPQWSPKHYMSSGGGDGGALPNSHEQREVRKEFAAATNLQRSYGDVFRLLDEAASVSNSNITGKYGKLASFTNSWLGFAENLALAASPTGEKPTITMRHNGEEINMSSGGGRAKWLQMNKNWLRKNIPNLPQDAHMADRYLALMNEIAYAKAMAQEGGTSRSLSDADHKNAMISIGAELENPATMAKILLADADRVHDRLQLRFKMYNPTSRENLVYKDAWEEYSNVRSALEPYRQGAGFFQQPPGTSAASGGGPVIKSRRPVGE